MTFGSDQSIITRPDQSRGISACVLTATKVSSNRAERKKKDDDNVYDEDEDSEEIGPHDTCMHARTIVTHACMHDIARGYNRYTCRGSDSTSNC